MYGVIYGVAIENTDNQNKNNFRISYYKNVAISIEIVKYKDI